MDINASLAKADEATLKEIVRNAESYLSAQLTAALAANQRAMTFTGLIAGAALLIGGATGSALLREQPAGLLAGIGLTVMVGLLSAMGYAISVAKPMGFYYVGNEPRNWVADVDLGMSFKRSLAEQCAHYDAMIISNRERMEEADKSLQTALGVAWFSLAVGVVLLAGFWLAKANGYAI